MSVDALVPRRDAPAWAVGWMSGGTLGIDNGGGGGGGFQIVQNADGTFSFGRAGDKSSPDVPQFQPQIDTSLEGPGPAVAPGNWLVPGSGGGGGGGWSFDQFLGGSDVTVDTPATTATTAAVNSGEVILTPEGFDWQGAIVVAVLIWLVAKRH